MQSDDNAQADRPEVSDDSKAGIHMSEGRTFEALCYSFYNSLTLLFCEVLAASMAAASLS